MILKCCEYKKERKVSSRRRVTPQEVKSSLCKGSSVDGQYLKTQMKILVTESGNDLENKCKASDKWLHNFTKRWGISRQKKINKKSMSIDEWLPQIQNFHWYTIYKMATEDP